MELDNEWEHFLKNSNLDNLEERKNIENKEEVENNLDLLNVISKSNNIIPEASELYISTKTKIIYLNIPIDIYNVFWKIIVNDYDIQEEGIIKKQIKISSITKEDLEKIIELSSREKNVYNNILNHIDNPNGRIKFKDIRKISIGISKKDLLFTRSKDKSAFYNCFVITLRIKQNNTFKEFHVKVFNTGKLEIPGLQNDESLHIIIDKIINLLTKITNQEIFYIKENTENVLINSNFNCGFFINRENLFNILRYKYNINTNYDSCSYPGIQCVYYHHDKETNNKTKISFMIFRTGSILIVGKCEENILNIVYKYIKNILRDEYYEIATKNIIKLSESTLKKKVKLKKKVIVCEK